MHLLALIIFGALLAIIYLLSVTEGFNLNHYLRRNYESGANMLRGDLPIVPVQQSWFNTSYGPSILTPGFF